MYKVIVASDAFRQIFSSALEAYSVPHGKDVNLDNHKPRETYGTLWGYSTKNCDDTIFNILSADVDSSAHRTTDWVRRKKGAQIVKNGFNQQFHPELSYFGDFHSHPYSLGEFGLQNAQEVENGRLYRFSGSDEGETEDFASVKDIKQQGLAYNVGIVATIFRMTNRVANQPAYLLDAPDKYSALKFTYTGADADDEETSFRCWLKAYVFIDASAKPLSDDKVRIHCGPLGLIPR